MVCKSERTKKCHRGLVDCFVCWLICLSNSSLFSFYLCFSSPLGLLQNRLSSLFFLLRILSLSALFPGFQYLPYDGNSHLTTPILFQQLPNQRRQRQVIIHRKEEISKRKFLDAQKIVEQQKITDRQNFEAHFARRVESGRKRLRIPVSRE